MPLNISTLTINAPKEKVWDALTKPELVKLWQFGSVLTTDWNVGSSIRFSTEWQGEAFEQWGTVLDVRPYDFLQYNLFAPRPGLEDKPENYFIMSYVLTDTEDGHTQLQIKQDDNRPGAEQEEPQGEENPVLQALKKVAEEHWLA
ncbi:SRPBCC family protein [Polluticoccus soli]|uniref:SRPBCC family protein n=1 Tax=Polluticoccus soli TaxID=3034150 RepID=UPI0023E2655D|nr:SRPBCC family protein [Flavipsychrobacter sp. JY13-12]